MEALDQIKPANADKNILIPLTSSLYVSGRFHDSEIVLVDIGTGYYVEKSTNAAQQVYNTKILTIKSNLVKLTTTIEQKDSNLNSIINIMKQKFAQKDREIAAEKLKLETA